MEPAAGGIDVGTPRASQRLGALSAAILQSAGAISLSEPRLRMTTPGLTSAEQLFGRCRDPLLHPLETCPVGSRDSVLEPEAWRTCRRDRTRPFRDIALRCREPPPAGEVGRTTGETLEGDAELACATAEIAERRAEIPRATAFMHNTFRLCSASTPTRGRQIRARRARLRASGGAPDVCVQRAERPLQPSATRVRRAAIAGQLAGISETPAE